MLQLDGYAIFESQAKRGSVRLTAVTGNRSRLLNFTQRARIRLLSAERLSTHETVRRAGFPRPAVIWWQRRFADACVEIPLRDKYALAGWRFAESVSQPGYSAITKARIRPMSVCTISPHVIIAGTRRQWTREGKRSIFDEAESTIASISSGGRRPGLTPSLLSRWRREAREERAVTMPVPPPFVPLALPVPVDPPTRDFGPPGGAIQLELVDGHRLHVEAGADPALVQDLLAALLERGSPFPRGRACGWTPVTRA